MVQPCTVSETQRLTGQKMPIFPISLSFYALARGEPFKYLEGPYKAKNKVLGLSTGEDLVILACILSTQCWPMTEDGQTPQQ